MASKTHKIVLSVQDPNSNIELTIPVILEEKDLIKIVDIMNKKQLSENTKDIDIQKILNNLDLE